MIQSAPVAQPQRDVVSQLLPTQIAIQQVLQQITQNQVPPASVPVPVSSPAPPAVEPLCEPPPPKNHPNADNHLAAWRHSNRSRTQTIFLIRVEVEALMQREKKKLLQQPFV